MTTIVEKLIIGVVGYIAVEAYFKPVQKQIPNLLKWWWEKKYRKDQLQVYTTKPLVVQDLLRLEMLPGVLRAMQKQTKNGGGVPEVGTSVYEYCVAPVKYSEEFSGQQLDAHYCVVVGDLIKNKKSVILKSDIGKADYPDSMLRDRMEAINAECCVLFDALITKTYYTFIKLDLSVPYESLSADTRNEIRQIVANLKKNIKNKN